MVPPDRQPSSSIISVVVAEGSVVEDSAAEDSTEETLPVVASAAEADSEETCAEETLRAVSGGTTSMSATPTLTVWEVHTGMRPSITVPGIVVLRLPRAWLQALRWARPQRDPTPTTPTTTVSNVGTIRSRLAIDPSKGHVTFVACPCQQESKTEANEPQFQAFCGSSKSE